MVEKLVSGPPQKTKIEHISGETVQRFVQFVFIVFPAQRLSKCIETKLPTTCFYFIWSFFRKQKEVWN